MANKIKKKPGAKVNDFEQQIGQVSVSSRHSDGLVFQSVELCF